jgi:hypothetical protein
MTLTDLRNWAHSGIAIIGVLALLYGAATMAIASADPSFSAAHSQQLIWVGGLFAIGSKFIDSANNSIAMLAGIWPFGSSTQALPAAPAPPAPPPAA